MVRKIKCYQHELKGRLTLAFECCLSRFYPQYRLAREEILTHHYAHGLPYVELLFIQRDG